MSTTGSRLWSSRVRTGLLGLSQKWLGLALVRSQPTRSPYPLKTDGRRVNAFEQHTGEACCSVDASKTAMEIDPEANPIVLSLRRW